MADYNTNLLLLDLHASTGGISVPSDYEGFHTNTGKCRSPCLERDIVERFRDFSVGAHGSGRNITSYPIYLHPEIYPNWSSNQLHGGVKWISIHAIRGVDPVARVSGHPSSSLPYNPREEHLSFRDNCYTRFQRSHIYGLFRLRSTQCTALKSLNMYCLPADPGF